ncbi:MAG: hypothetical protein H7346_22070 [Burkholderiaceae bacterium]|nr:hypothetical protein [Burkholderiaceae bacterium]
MHKPAPLALAVALAFAATAQAQGPAPAARPGVPASGAPVLSYSNVQPNASIASTLPLEFTLASPLQASRGQLTLLVNGNDVGSFLQTSDAVHFVLEPGQFPLPAGPLEFELVFEPANGGEPTVLLKAQATLQTQGEVPRGQVDPGIPPDATALIGVSGVSGVGGSEGQPEGGQVGSASTSPGLVPKAAVQAGVTSTSRNLNGVKTSAVTRELALQLGLRYESESDGRRLAIGSNFIGNSQQAKAVRFGTDGAAASKIDLNDYLVEFQTATARLSIGNTSVAGNPLLGQSFDNRGISGAYRWNSGFDVAFTSQYATALVGAQPLFGFSEFERRMSAVTLGWEAMPEQPGVLRVEATALTGAVERSRINVSGPGAAPAPVAPGSGASRAPESSHGLGLRVLWAPVNSIYKVEAAYAKSTSAQPNPLGGELVQRGRAAYFVDGSARVIDGPADGGAATRRLVLRLRHESADTGFRSIAGGMGGDVQRTLLGAEGAWGVFTGQLNHTIGRNNVSRIQGLPVLETVSDTFNLGVPLSRLMADPAPAPQPQPQNESQDASSASALALQPAPPSGSWWPTLQLGVQHSKQRAVSIPATLTPALVPAAATTNATLNAQWTRNAWTWSGGFTYGLQDNQQPGSENQDQRTRGVQAQVQWQATPTLAANVGVRRSRATAADTGISQIQTGVDLGASWQLDPGWTFNAQYSTNADRDSIYSQQNRGRNFQFQAGKIWNVPMGPGKLVPLQLSLRLQQQVDRNNSSFGGATTQNDQRSRTASIIVSATF